jgi:hypothetical protein
MFGDILNFDKYVSSHCMVGDINISAEDEMVMWILFREHFEICSRGLCLSKDGILKFDNIAFCVSSLMVVSFVLCFVMLKKTLLRSFTVHNFLMHAGHMWQLKMRFYN